MSPSPVSCTFTHNIHVAEYPVSLYVIHSNLCKYRVCLWRLGILLDFDILVNLVDCIKMPKTANKFRGLLMRSFPEPCRIDWIESYNYRDAIAVRTHHLQIQGALSSSRSFSAA